MEYKTVYDVFHDGGKPIFQTRLDAYYIYKTDEVVMVNVDTLKVVKVYKFKDIKDSLL